MIKLEDVSKQFGDKVVLNHVNLEIEEGSVFGLIGPNGAGKSTLLRIMSDVVMSDTGSVTYNDVNVFDNVAVKRSIFLVSDEPFYFMHASISDMKKFYKTWYPSFDEEIYRKFLNVFKLDDKKPIREFSKGMKRQSFIVLALAIGPSYLFLDEAFDGLDPIMRLSFKRAINEMIEEKKMTIIISSHNLRELEDICDTFGILENCNIITSGNIDEMKCQMHKIQLAFDHPVQEREFANLEVLSITIHSRIVNMVVKGRIDEIKNTLHDMHPLLIETLNLTLEEVFLYEMKRKGYDVYEG